MAVNARVNHVRVRFSGRDILGSPPPECDVILAGDVCYEEAMAGSIARLASAGRTPGYPGTGGDPGRRYLPPDLERLSTYQVHTSLELERADVTESGVFRFRPTHPSRPDTAGA